MLYYYFSVSSFEFVTKIKSWYRYKEAASGHDRGDVCLDATRQRKRSSEEFRRGSFFPCIRHENQVCQNVREDEEISHPYYLSL